MADVLLRNLRMSIKILSGIFLAGIRQLIPSFLPYSIAERIINSTEKSSTAHLLGFRGLVIVLIMFERFITPFSSDFTTRGSDSPQPTMTKNSMFALLFVLSGYVMTLNIVRLARQELWRDAFNCLLKTTTQRCIVLLLPALVSTYLIMLGETLRLLKLELFQESTRPNHEISLWAQYLDWVNYDTNFLLDLWPSPANFPLSNYGGHLWVIPLELKGTLVSSVTMLLLSCSRSNVALCIAGVMSLLAMAYNHDSTSLVLIGMTMAAVKINTSGLWCNFDQIGLGFSYGMIISSIFFFLGILSTVYAWFPERNCTSHWEFILLPNNHLYLNAGAVLLVGCICFLSPLQPWFRCTVLHYLGYISNSLFVLHEPLLQIFGWKVSLAMQKATGTLHISLQAVGQALSFLLVAILVICMSDCFFRLVEMPSSELASWLSDSLLTTQALDKMLLDVDDSQVILVPSYPLLSEEYHLAHLKDVGFKSSSSGNSLSGLLGVRLRGLALVHAIFGVLVITSCFLSTYLDKYTDRLSKTYEDKYIRYAVPYHNRGPRFQELLTPDNVTNWLPDHLKISDFATRLDDQTLYPQTESTDFEVKVRHWFLQHYPVLEDVYQEGLHLNKTYLSPPRSQRHIILDDRFHITHCVVFWRRYFNAVTEGRHVTPRDMDLGHLGHCLHSLEQFTMDDDVWCANRTWGLEWKTTVSW